MFQLLTEEERRKVGHEYVVRRTIVLLCAFVLALAVGIIGLFPSYTLSSIRRLEALERTKAVGSARQRNDDLGLQVWLEEINLKLKLLSPALDTDRPSNFIDKILDQKSAGILITDFSLAKSIDKVDISINGVAANRQSLITFKDRLNSSGNFSNVVSPISNLTKDKNIDFQITFSPL
ncbi:MAG: hypothetical protein HYX23_02105 [Candidatus Zambryskibacteria bacterium]|nr:hypothetical protein [Candidatus Zambryskibacteria bacterium]